MKTVITFLLGELLLKPGPHVIEHANAEVRHVQFGDLNDAGG